MISWRHDLVHGVVVGAVRQAGECQGRPVLGLMIPLNPEARHGSALSWCMGFLSVFRAGWMHRAAGTRVITPAFVLAAGAEAF